MRRHRHTHFALRFTNDKRQKRHGSGLAIAADMFMNTTGQTFVLMNRGGAACKALLIVWTWRRGVDVGQSRRACLTCF